ncbi:MAG: acetylornithine carbamoyltransferase [Flavobacteriaceae bacterium]|nr:acetylornithine carbamoyltransferase [Flavobacteriaceae bacterium]|tara:strand:+ start:396 stop:1349 length:954 start_codon:yes stop_codon:yes gene_type:complete
MKNFFSLNDILDIKKSISEIIDLKKAKNDKSQYINHRGKTIGLIFFNPSLRTRISTFRASKNLGLETFFINISENTWSLEFEDGKIMNASNVEHIKDAARVISQYCDIIGVRSFASLKNKKKDLSEHVLKSFIRYSKIPVFNMESSTAHPLQALSDIVTIKETSTKKTPKVLLTWAPHIKPLAHAVPNSFIRAMKKMNFDLTISNPKGYDLDESITEGVVVNNDQYDSFKNVDYVYAKNWSSYQNYGKVYRDFDSWTINSTKMNLTNNGKFMHCLPIRRNVVATDEVIDSSNSLILKQSENRIYSAQYIIKKLLENE